LRFPAGNRRFGNDPLLKAGIIMMAVALVLALGAVVLSLLLRGAPERAVASERVASTKSSAAPLIRDESPAKPWREQERRVSAPKVSKNESNPAPSGGEPKPGSTPDSQAEPLPQLKSQAESAAQPGQRIPAVGEGDWSSPTPQEIEAANGPRYYDMPPGAIMSLTIPSMGIYGAPVFDSVSPMALAKGVAHLPDTSLPWSPTPQRNVYLAGHRMGFRGTWSRMIFYNLDKLGKGDRVLLKDRRGRTYAYRVSDTFLVDPTDQWVTGQVRGRDMLTLQTCTPIPTFEKRLIVRANRL
jgi:sortase A